jgi:hypothetical protein
VCCRIDLESDVNRRYGVFGGAFAENQIGISSESGDNMASRSGWDMIANLKARAIFGARDAVFVIGVKEGIMGDLVGRHEVEECFWMGFQSHGERQVARRMRTAGRGEGCSRNEEQVSIVRMLQLETSLPPLS